MRKLSVMEGWSICQRISTSTSKRRTLIGLMRCVVSLHITTAKLDVIVHKQTLTVFPHCDRTCLITLQQLSSTSSSSAMLLESVYTSIPHSKSETATFLECRRSGAFHVLAQTQPHFKKRIPGLVLKLVVIKCLKMLENVCNCFYIFSNLCLYFQSFSNLFVLIGYCCSCSK